MPNTPWKSLPPTGGTTGTHASSLKCSNVSPRPDDPRVRGRRDPHRVQVAGRAAGDGRPVLAVEVNDGSAAAHRPDVVAGAAPDAVQRIDTPESSMIQPPAWRRWMMPSAPTANVSFAPGDRAARRSPHAGQRVALWQRIFPAPAVALTERLRRWGLLRACPARAYRDRAAGDRAGVVAGWLVVRWWRQVVSMPPHAAVAIATAAAVTVINAIFAHRPHVSPSPDPPPDLTRDPTSQIATPPRPVKQSRARMRDALDGARR